MLKALNPCSIVAIGVGLWMILEVSPFQDLCSYLLECYQLKKCKDLFLVDLLVQAEEFILYSQCCHPISRRSKWSLDMAKSFSASSTSLLDSSKKLVEWSCAKVCLGFNRHRQVWVVFDIEENEQLSSKTRNALDVDFQPEGVRQEEMEKSEMITFGIYCNEERISRCCLRPIMSFRQEAALFGNSEGSSDCPGMFMFILGDRIVRSYLLHYGYHDTLASFDTASGSTFPPVFFAPQENGIKFSDGETYALDQRKLLRQLIRNGDIDSAFNKLREWYPQLVQVWRLLLLCNNGGNGIDGDIFHPNHTLTTSFEFLTMVLVEKECRNEKMTDFNKWRKSNLLHGSKYDKVRAFMMGRNCAVSYSIENRYRGWDTNNHGGDALSMGWTTFIGIEIAIIFGFQRIVKMVLALMQTVGDKQVSSASHSWNSNMSLIQILSSWHRLRKSAGQCYEYGGGIDYRDWDHLYVWVSKDNSDGFSLSGYNGRDSVTCWLRIEGTSNRLQDIKLLIVSPRTLIATTNELVAKP
eukprot:Gb_30126 [translate_table: standard]